ncbi:rhomboid family intramembrane serine protease [Methylomonas sp. AM2-LC]|uniref:rhomboid family intramembrane serine protease n=1 Tax=Methylomonas sp. AM2-LC TaxID=3153301 RepID=UPI003264295F
MLIVPVGRKPDWRRPPIVTLLLVLVNCFVFFGFQYKDYQARDLAAVYYFQHDLQTIEFPRYEAYLRQQGQVEKADKIAQKIEKKDYSVLGELEHDRVFLKSLAADKIVKDNERIYYTWKPQRQEFNRMLGTRFSDRYAFDSRDLKPITFISHQFMHAGFGHLFGNMLILLLVGYIVEDALGSVRFLLFYLLGGMGAASVFWAASLGHDIALVGASGSIAAVMGMYTVLFGLRKIEFFYWILIYFDLARLPAIVLLPVWVGNEIYQKLSTPESNVAYMAHAGGLVTGALLVYMARLLGKLKVDTEFEQEAAQGGYKQELELADALMHKLEIDKARQAYFILLEKYPGHPELLAKLFNLCKNQPLSTHFQRLSSKVFALSSKDDTSVALQAQMYKIHMQIASSPKIKQTQALDLIARFIHFHHLSQAEHLLEKLLQNASDDLKLPGLLAALIKRQRLAGKAEHAEKNRQRLQLLFPDSQEARVLESL